MDGKRFDRICSEDVRQQLAVAIADKLHESRLRYLGHVLRAESDKFCKMCFDLDAPDKRTKERRKQRWLDILHADLKLVRIHPDNTMGQSGDKRSAKDPYSKRDKR